MYYECHVTIDPVYDKALEDVKIIASHANFKVAKFIMQKDQNIQDTFMTSQDAEMSTMVKNLNKLLHELQGTAVVRRYKIEHIIFDTKLHGIF